MHHNKISIYVSGLSIFLNPGFSILVEASLFNLGWVTVWGLLVDDQIQCRANRVVETSSRLTLMLLSLLLIFNYLVHTMQNERVLRGCVKDFGRQLPFSVVNVARIVAKFVEFSMPLFFESSFFRFIRNDVSISVIYRSSLYKVRHHPFDYAHWEDAPWRKARWYPLYNFPVFHIWFNTASQRIIILSHFLSNCLCVIRCVMGNSVNVNEALECDFLS